MHQNGRANKLWTVYHCLVLAILIITLMSHSTTIKKTPRNNKFITKTKHICYENIVLLCYNTIICCVITQYYVVL